MRLVSVKRSTRDGKKWMATFCDCKGGTKCAPTDRRVVHFGATGYQDYTTSHDKERRRLYRIRHAKEKNQKPDTPGALAYHLLWGESTSLQTNIAAFRKKIGCR